MNKGFLMFSEEEPGLTMLKDEPDDLTHLAPTAGDACIPLEETGPFFNDVFDDFMIPESYTSLLQDELNSLDSAEQRLSISVSSVASPITINGTTISTISHQTASHSSLSSSSASSITSTCSPSSCSVASPSSLSSSSTATNGTSGTSTSSGIGSGASTAATSNSSNNSQSSGASSNDPFINYRDEISEISHSPHLLSPGLSKSPEGSSIPSLCSPNGSGGCPEDELAFMTLNMDDDLDLSMRAPYISMSEVDDLPLLTSDDLMWGAAQVSIVEGSSSVKYHHLKDEFSGHQQQQDTATKSPQVTVNVNVARTDQQQTNNSNTSNNHNIENNCNIGNKIIDSSLAALLCGNVINIQTSTIQLQQAPQQHQQQNCTRQQLLIQQAQDSIIAADVQQQLQQQQREILGDKKISLVHHPMVVISNGYKNSSNAAATPNTIEAWAMGNELLLNGVNGQNNQNSSTTTSTTTSSSSNSTSSAAGSKLNVIASIVSKKSGSSSGGNSSTKRSLAASESGTDGTSKRVKSGSGAVQTTTTTSSSSPQLLQQLMAPSPVPAKAKAKSKLDQSDRWPTGAAGAGASGAGKQADQVSNSVLMNLLVSGCDTNIPKSPPEILIADEGSCQGIVLKRDELSDDEESVPILQANPMLGSAATGAAVPLTIHTDSPPPTQDLASPPQVEDFLMTVSPSLLTPSDLELWRAIQLHGLDPKKIRPVSPGVPAAVATASNLLAVLDPAMAISRLRNVDDEDEQDFEMTIPVNEILQNNLI